MRIVAPEEGPKSFGTFEKRAPADNCPGILLKPTMSKVKHNRACSVERDVICHRSERSEGICVSMMTRGYSEKNPNVPLQEVEPTTFQFPVRMLYR